MALRGCSAGPGLRYAPSGLPAVKGAQSMSEGFTIANFRHVAKGLQPGQFSVAERKRALGLADLDPKYKQLLDQPVTMTLGLIGPDGRLTLPPMWFDYEGDKLLVNTASIATNANGFVTAHA